MKSRQGSKSSGESGSKFVREVARFLVEKLPSGVLVGVVPSPVQGASGELWKPDLEVFFLNPPKPGVTSEFVDTPVGPAEIGSLHARAVFECKHVSPDVSKKAGSYHSHMTRAYMELNDIRLKEKEISLYLIVNRRPLVDEYHKDYNALFESIGVRLVSFEQERDVLVSELMRLLPG